MIVGVNGRFLTKPYTGIGQYTRSLFAEVARQNPDDTFVMVVPSKVSVEFPPNVKIVLVRERFFGTAGMKKTHWEQVKVTACFRKHGVEIVHFPYPSNPWRGFDVPVVVTVHDAIPWMRSEYRRGFLTRLYQDRARKAVGRADKVVTVSQASKRDILKVCSVQKEDVEVVYNAPGPVFSKVFTEDARKQVLRKYMRLSRPYFLYVGGYDARKNVGMLVKTFLDTFDGEVDLVLAGEKALDGPLYASLDEARGKKHVILTGFVEEADMPALYQGAFAFVNLSSAEGFNLPLVEAAMSGTVMIVSNIPVHHEVIGEHALYAGVDDAQGLAAMMKRLLEDKSFYAGQKAAMEAYECPYSLEASARNVMEVYKSLLG